MSARPSMSGFSVLAATAFGAETSSSGSNSKGTSYSVAGLYSAGPFSGSLSWQEVKSGSANSGDNGAAIGAAQASPDNKAKAWKLGASYAMDAFTVNGVYEKLSSSGSNGGANPPAIYNGLDRKSWYLGGKYAFSAADTVKLAYTKTGDLGTGAATGGSTANTSASQWSIGADHSMSKRTTVYALYTKVSNALASSFRLGTAATSVSGTSATADADPSAFSIGMKHSF